MAKEKIIIVGGGISGLVAAKELAPFFHITIIEADRKLGGRIDSREDFSFIRVVEAGPEFVHGHLPNTLHLLQEAAIATVLVEGKMYYKEAGVLKIQKEELKGWDELLNSMRNLKTDMTLFDFLKKFFPADEHAMLRSQATRYAEGFDLADVKTVSVRSLYLEWSNEASENFRIPQGYRSLVNFLEWECLQRNCDIVQGKSVKQIEWEPGSAIVRTNDVQEFRAGKVIVSVPLSILQKKDTAQSIIFSPAIDEYIDATSNIGMGIVIKVLVQFKKRLWPADAGFIFSSESIPTWWTMLPDEAPILTGWAGGQKAEALKDENDDVIVKTAIASLASIFDISFIAMKEQIEVIEVFNWKKRAYIGAAYSYSTLESSRAKTLLNTPVSDTIYFMGEGLYTGETPGTVEAAIVNAKETVARIIEAKRR